ncbi:MAG TPA: SIS domain-containing protein [Rhodanobacteraceae bacterium]|nr:SIS domain-containing protein [Rhodanobacteraceae bacterium]
MNIHATFAEHRTVMDAALQLAPSVEEAIALLHACLAAHHKILACGNGGSAAQAQHFAAELVGRFRIDRRALPALALTADTAALTAIANDAGYARVFARQVEALATPGDALLAISTSGQSANVIQAAKVAQAGGCGIVAMTGADGGALASLANVALRAPSRVVARAQEVHGVWIHILAQALEEQADG